MTPSDDDTHLRWLTEADVADLVSINDAVGLLRAGFTEEAEGTACALDKALGVWPQGAMHALGAMSAMRGHAGFKTWVHTKEGATAVFSLFDMANGRLLSMLEAATLGQIRTSAVSGLGADLLAVADASEMALVGTGNQALTQVAAIATVRSLRRLKVFSPTVSNRDAFVAKARACFPFEVVDCGSIEEAVAGTQIVTLITRTATPFLKADMVAPGALIIAAGAILPDAAECHSDVLERAGLVVVDSIGNARKNSRELRERFGAEEKADWSSVRTLGAMLRDGETRSTATDLAFFKPMGTGLSDLMIASTAFERAHQRSIGLGIVQPKRVQPKWTVATASG